MQLQRVPRSILLPLILLGLGCDGSSPSPPHPASTIIATNHPPPYPADTAIPAGTVIITKPPTNIPPLTLVKCEDKPHAAAAMAPVPDLQGGKSKKAVCVWFCETGYLDCDHDRHKLVSNGCETDSSKRDNCDACGHVCPDSVQCSPILNSCDAAGKACDDTQGNNYFCGEPLACENGFCCPMPGDTSRKCPATACCKGDVCIDGVCQLCKEKGDSCTDNGQCCSGTSCRDGLCKPACNENAACDLKLQGPCDDGKWKCSGIDPLCVQVVFPASSDDTCNGIDDDCSGKTDEDYAPHSCTYTPTHCQAGFTVPSETKCSSGKEQCKEPDYCSICGGECGTCGNSSCQARSSSCSPGYACVGPAGSTECKGVGCPGMKCWMPADVNVNGTCP